MATIDEPLSLKRSATLSPCGQFRYGLSRWWTDDTMIPENHVLWVMLNPSTADAEIDDATIRRCIAFSRDWGFDGMTVGNLYAYRTKDPQELRKANFPIGEVNDRWLGVLGMCAAQIVCAWGTHCQPHRSREVRQLLQKFGPTHALRVTKDGFPSHPLYLPGELAPQPWIG